MAYSSVLAARTVFSMLRFKTRRLSRPGVTWEELGVEELGREESTVFLFNIGIRDSPVLEWLESDWGVRRYDVWVVWMGKR